jgi:beta propeller repeat protein
MLLFAAPALAAPGTTSQLSHGSATDQQNSPAISGTKVVWTDALSSAGGSNFDIYAYDIATGAAPINLTNTPDDNEFLEDVDGTNVVWTHTSAGVAGDIVVYDLSTNKASTVASSTTDVHYQQPAITGRWLTFLQVTSSQIDVDLLDNATGTPYFVTNDAAVQGRPRVGADYVVYEDYNSGNADIYGWQISTAGPSFAIATGPDSQVTPDIDGNTVVYVETANGSDQLFSYNLITKATKQLTSAVSNKVLPRISGTRIVWSDDRNGNLDLYYYDLSTGTESPLVTGAGDQFLSDIDGDRVVYTDNAAGFEQVFLFTFTVVDPPPPPVLPEGCDPAKTNAVGASVQMQHSGWRPTYAGGSFTRQPGKTYWVCVDNGLADGSQRATQFSFEADHRVVLTPSDFRPVANPPQHVAAQIFDGHGKCNTHGLGHGDDDGGDAQVDWTAALFGRNPPIHATVTIRVSK